MTDDEMKLAVPLCIGGAGLALALVGLLLHGLLHWRVKGWTRIHGLIESYEEIPKGDGMVYNPWIKFLDAKGRKVRFKSEEHWNQPAHAVGTHVPVLYHPEHPGKAYRGDSLQPYLFAVAFYVLGGFLFLSSIGLLCFFQMDF